jgi:hypothetical protein
MGTTMKLARVMVIITSVVLLVTGTAQAARTPVRVLWGPVQQYSPTSNGTYIAWTQGPAGDSEKLTAFIKVLGHVSGTRLNALGTAGSVGSFLPGTDTLIYTQSRRAQSDLYFYNAANGHRSKPPPLVDSRYWESSAVASQSYILFIRFIATPSGFIERLLLFDRVNARLTTLIPKVPRGELVDPSFAGSTYVTWTACRRTCNAYYRDVAAGITKRIPLPMHRSQYAPYIDEANGQVYFARSLATPCGDGVSIRRAALSAPSTSSTVARLPTGVDVGLRLSVATDPLTTHQDLYFERDACRSRGYDIYVLRSVDTA